uniref:Si:dkey-23k10.2 n=1 Tax=Sinocyclocheilus grahami TaxID=75366 RepID=A0A672M8J8_SINGR
MLVVYLQLIFLQILSDEDYQYFRKKSSIYRLFSNVDFNGILVCSCMQPHLTNLYITEGGGGEINNEHEIRGIESAFRRAMIEDRPINLNEVFTLLPGQDQPIRTVLTKGVAGIGKTVSVQKFTLDWAEGKEKQDIHLIFPLPFRELNLMKDQKLSLKDLLRAFFPETDEFEISSDKFKFLLIFDGLDECRLSLDFQNSVRLCDVTKSASVDVLLTNLIVGTLLPSALIWITSRPAAADLIPSECVHRVTEVRGFSDSQKEEYFRKRVTDESLAERIISHLKLSRSLYIMCHIPVFCWISATVLEKMLSQAESGEIPKTLTQMYTHFLILQMSTMHEKVYDKKIKDIDLVLKLGKLAFQQLEKRNLIFYEEDLRECGIDVQEASVYSGLCSQIFREESGLVQEHLAALYVYHSFVNQNINVIDQPSLLPSIRTCGSQGSISDLHQRAVKKALQSPSGHLDLFLRFLLGFSLESNQTLLQSLLMQTESSSGSKERIVKKGITTLVSVLSSKTSCLKELNMTKSNVNDSGLKLLCAGLENPQCCDFLASTLRSNPSHLKELDLSGNKITNSGLKSLSAELQNPLCKLEKLCMRLCDITGEGCASLALVLSSNPSQLRELNLSGNKLGDLGMKVLADGLENPHCKLEILRLRDCGISHEGCAALASARRSNPSHLRELDLSGNTFGDTGLRSLEYCSITNEGCAVLASALKSNPSHLRELDLYMKNLQEEGCAALASTLRSNPSHLRELDLSQNKLGSSGVKKLSVALEKPDCKLEILR